MNVMLHFVMVGIGAVSPCFVEGYEPFKRFARTQTVWGCGRPLSGKLPGWSAIQK